MSTRIAVAAVAVALFVAGCGETCPTEPPQVNALASSCTQIAGEPVSYPVRLCPTCNQTGATCDVDLSRVNTTGEIFLDPKVEACTGSTSCGACAVSPLICSFIAPAAPGPYTVIAFDPTTNGTRQATLVVISSGAESCTL